MHEFVALLKDLNMPTILTIIGATWFFNRGLRRDIKELKEEVKDIHEDIKSIHKEFKFINIRLSRTEGTVYGKEIYKEGGL